MPVFFPEVNHGCYFLFMRNVSVKGRDINCDQEDIGWEGWKFLNKTEKMFCVFDVSWKIAS